MMKFMFCLAAGTTFAAMQFVPAQSVRPSPDRVQDTGHQDHAEYDRGDAGCFKGKNLPWVKCHAGTVGGRPAMALI
jgi:hypothetical protein